MQPFLGRALGILLVVFINFNVKASEWLSFESVASPSGKFDYTVKGWNHPYLSALDVFSFTVNFNGLIDQTIPANWTNDTTQASGGAYGTSVYTNLGANSLNFELQSSQTHWRSNLLIILLAVSVHEGWYGDMVGYCTAPTLVPCSAAEADGSPARFYTHYDLADIAIDQIIRTNHQVYGVQFSWYQDSTVRLEGSHDLKQWNTISQFFGSAPTTTWTTNVPLNSYGKFFRLQLVANYHLGDTLYRSTVADAKARILQTSVKDQKIQLQFVSTPGEKYDVEVKDAHGNVVQRDTVVAKENTTTTAIHHHSGLGVFSLSATRSTLK